MRTKNGYLLNIGLTCLMIVLIVLGVLLFVTINNIVDIEDFLKKIVDGEIEEIDLNLVYSRSKSRFYLGNNDKYNNFITNHYQTQEQQQTTSIYN